MTGVLVLLDNAGAASGIDITGEWMTWDGGPGDMWVWGNLGGGTIHLEASISTDDFQVCVTGTQLTLTGVAKFNFNHGTRIRAVLDSTTAISSGVFVKVN